MHYANDPQCEEQNPRNMKRERGATSGQSGDASGLKKRKKDNFGEVAKQQSGVGYDEKKKRSMRANRKAARAKTRMMKQMTKRSRPGAPEDEELKCVPKSFVIRRGKTSKQVVELRDDLRRVLAPWSAGNLKERKGNVLRDFTDAAMALGVSHLLTLSESGKTINLRTAKLPAGPTLTFAVANYVLSRDVRKRQKRPRTNHDDFKKSPLVVLSGFKTVKRTEETTAAEPLAGEDGNSVEKYKKALTITAVTLQNLFPAIDVRKVKLADCRRVVLAHHNADTEIVEFRQYAVLRRRAVGPSRGLRRVLDNSAVVDLSGANDIAEAVLGGQAGGVSESEAEEGVGTVVGEGIGDDKGGDDEEESVAMDNKMVVRLVELGPRIDMQLVKVEDEVCTGKVLYHRYNKKSGEELAAMEKQGEQRRKKESARLRKLEQTIEKKRKREEKEDDPEGDSDDEDGDENKRDEGDSDAEDDENDTDDQDDDGDDDEDGDGEDDDDEDGDDDGDDDEGDEEDEQDVYEDDDDDT